MEVSLPNILRQRSSGKQDRFIHIVLMRTELHGHTYMPGRLGNALSDWAVLGPATTLALWKNGREILCYGIMGERFWWIFSRLYQNSNLLYKELFPHLQFKGKIPSVPRLS